MHKRIILVFLISSFVTACSIVPRSFSPDLPLKPKEFSHQEFDQILRAHVQGGHVKYSQIAKNPNFSLYLSQLNHIAPNRLPTPNHRLAFWINAYNAFAIKGILDGYSPSTLMGRYQYFIGQKYMVGKEPITLYDLERKLLIPDFHEPRIHFAIVCASQSCPKLRSWSFETEQLDQQLNDSARQFINDPTRNSFDREQHIAYLSKIFDWFTDDFVNHSGSLTRYVAQFINDPKLAKELRQGLYSVEFLDYDWNLNGTPPDLAT